MGKNVKAWYDSRFLEDGKPKWNTFVEAMKERYLPQDHDIQVTKRYEGIVQTGSLTGYVEAWQSLMVAVKAAGIVRTNKDHVIQFVTGLAKMEDRKSILDKEPDTLEDVYRAVTRIHHYSLLAHKYGRTGSTGDESKKTKEERFHLKMLQGAEKAKAFRDGLCIGCGKKGHFVVNCEETKKHLKVLKRFEKAAVQAGATRKNLKGNRKGVRFHLTETEEESEPEYDSTENSGDPESDTGTEIEESEVEEESGNETPGPQGGDR